MLGQDSSSFDANGNLIPGSPLWDQLGITGSFDPTAMVQAADACAASQGLFSSGCTIDPALLDQFSQPIVDASGNVIVPAVSSADLALMGQPGPLSILNPFGPTTVDAQGNVTAPQLMSGSSWLLWGLIGVGVLFLLKD